MDDAAAAIAILIPAHNEEASIVATINSIQQADYSGCFEVFVIADNCTDATASLALSRGAHVWKRFDTLNPGKGQAIQWAVSNHQEVLDGFDYVAFVDADTQVDQQFLSKVNSALSIQGVDVIQGFHGVLNGEDNWRASFTYLGFAGVNHVRPCGQYALGGSAGIKGNGMAFRRELLQQFGWPAHSIVEDLEMTLRLLLSGHRVAYVGDAVVRSEMPLTAGQAYSQRERWEGGRHQVAKQYLPQLLKRFFTTGQWRYFDAVLDLMVPPFTLMLLLACCVLLVGLWAAHGVLVYVGVVGILCVMAYSCSALLQTGASLKVWRNLLAAPLFLLWKVPLSLRLLGSRQRAWKRTSRNSEQ
ncbi:glycosyltransferase family 2 protein [Porticoccus sp. W117]|uniref:glycosyltransferase family 2 protein n=1 Tax=Porticoccus sp. W117 TaxID=3054777 RepID=UPI0025944BD3|nr:glycosyltransferase family 2 protein [Porticoccus sp. W117]MDM3870604.1 glycosyltransferase family 2 protein [Porticoccus sp. W117]